jgi:hypothetical protein
MLADLTQFMTQHDWRLIAAAIACFAASALAFGWCRRLRRQNTHLLTALNNMSEGLCMFDASARLILCNGRYIEMYGLSADIAKPGCSLRGLLEERKRANTFAGDADRYIAEARRRMAEGQGGQDVGELNDGRFISISSRPMAGGGWVATHQDITERRRQDQQRDRLVSQEQRRAMIEAAIATFRQRVEAMLKTVSDSAVAMRATATTLFASSHKASQRAVGAVHSSNEASANVEIAASAANERPPRSTRSAASSRRPASLSASPPARQTQAMIRSARWRRPPRKLASSSSSFRM